MSYAASQPNPYCIKALDPLDAAILKYQDQRVREFYEGIHERWFRETCQRIQDMAPEDWERVLSALDK